MNEWEWVWVTAYASQCVREWGEWDRTVVSEIECEWVGKWVLMGLSNSVIASEWENVRMWLRKSMRLSESDLERESESY